MSTNPLSPDGGPHLLTATDPLIESAYAMKGDGVVRIADVRDGPAGQQCAVFYVHHHYQGDVQGGGSSFWYGRKDVTPITTPYGVLLAFADHARRAKAEAEHAAEAAGKVYAATITALRAMKLAEQLTASTVIASASPPAPKES